MVCGYLPQALYTIRTRDTDGIALTTFVMMGAGSLFFVVQGLMLGNWPLIITNVITTVCSAIILFIKFENHMKRRRKKDK